VGKKSKAEKAAAKAGTGKELVPYQAKGLGDPTAYGSIEEMWREVFGQFSTIGGRSINWRTALQVTTVLRCVSVIAEGCCSIPFKLYRRREKTYSVDGNEIDYVERKEARDHPLYDIFSTQPNDFQSGFEFMETMVLHAVLCGNAFAFINRVGSDRRIAELIVIEPGHVTVQRDTYTGAITYRVTPPNGETRVFRPENIWHLKNRSWNTYEGLETIKLAREAIGLAISAEETAARTNDKAIRPSGVLSVEGELDETQHKLYTRWLQKNYSGNNKGLPLILDRNAKWFSQHVSMVDQQHIQTRNHEIEEICRALGVMPIMVGATGDKAPTYASAEQLFIQHVVSCLRPWHRRIEGSADRWLLSREERRRGLYMGFVDGELLRGDSKARAEFYRLGIESGWMLRSDVRGWEELPFIPGLDRPTLPMNTDILDKDGVPIVKPVATPEPEDAPAQEPAPTEEPAQ
jgi:HK97 family phage portal protein